MTAAATTAVFATGDGPGEFYLQQDKALSKKLLAYEHILYPDFLVFSRDADLETGGNFFFKDKLGVTFDGVKTAERA